MSNLKVAAKKIFPNLVYKSYNFIHPEKKIRNLLLQNYNINLLLDVGGQRGLYAHAVRHNGYNGRMVSFEPVKESFDQLLALSSKDKNWIAVNIGMGDTDASLEINVSENLVSSSLLDMKSYHKELVPSSKYIRKETITVKRLDTVFNDYYKSGDRVFVKIDTQGYEKRILDGSKQSLKNISGFQLELSVQPLYEQELSYIEMFEHMKSLGYELKSLEQGWHDLEKGNLMQFDALFFKD